MAWRSLVAKSSSVGDIVIAADKGNLNRLTTALDEGIGALEPHRSVKAGVYEMPARPHPD